jgi:flagellar biosynthetic protein FlhB
MALGDDAGAQERSEQPTARRREEARGRGQVARSADLGSAVLLLGGFGMYALNGTALLTDLLGAFRAGLLPLPSRDLTAADVLALYRHAIATWAPIVAPFVVLPAAGAIAAQLLQTRFALSTHGLAPDWSRLHPLKNLGRLLGLASLVELVKAVLKLTAVGTIAWVTLRAYWPALLDVGMTGVPGTLGVFARVLGDVWFGIALAWLGIAAADYAWQWWRHEKSLRMTRDEVREETKLTEGNPLLRGRLKTIHRHLVSRKMLAEVKRADVVLRNPTHVAVALRYDGGRMGAPRVVAKGERHMALKIIEIARRHHVLVLENPPLARTLFALVKVGAEIPAHLYRAVAEVLAYVYSIRGGRR